MSARNDPGAAGRGPLGEGPAVLAFDVGGTSTKSAIIDSFGVVHGMRRTPTPRSADDPSGMVLAEIDRQVSSLRAENPEITPLAVGFSVPGLVDAESGVGVFSSNLGWRDVPLRDRARSRLHLPVAFGHDVQAAAIAEHRLGAARGTRDAVVVIIGTGIAATLILGGRAFAGTGFAGELGHCLSRVGGDPCPCGATGCLETIASAAAIARRYNAATGQAVSGAREVMSRAQQDDPVARSVWNEAIDALAESLARVTAIIAPETIVVGGGLAQARRALFVPLERKLDGLLSFHQRPTLRPAALGGDAGLLGTALRARALYEDSERHPGGGAE